MLSQYGLRINNDKDNNDDDENEYMVLDGVHFEAVVTDLTAHVKLYQEYLNTYKQMVSTSYVFPIDPAAALHSVKATIDKKTIETTIKEKEAAKKEYTEAVTQNKQAVLLEGSGDIFRMNVGNLPSQARCIVEIQYDAELTMVGNEIRFCIPSYVAPRYSSSSSSTVANPFSTARNIPCLKGVAPAMRQQMRVTFQMPNQILTTRSTASGINLSMTSNCCHVVTFTQQRVNMKQDIEIFVGMLEPHVPRGALQWNKTTNTGVLQVAVCPQMITDTEQIADAKIEMLFVLDYSGSMFESEMNVRSIDALHSAMNVALTSLPATSLINVVLFGGTARALWPDASPALTETTRNAAMGFVRDGSDMGGTDILWAMKLAIAIPVKQPGYVRQMILITDGQVSDQDMSKTMQLVNDNKSNTRFFTIGIGHQVSQAVIREIATVGGGTFEIVSDANEVIGPVQRQLLRAVQPAIVNASVDVTSTGLFQKNPSSIESWPAKPTPIFPESRNFFHYYIASADLVADHKSPTVKMTFLSNVEGAKHEVVDVPVKLLDEKAPPTVRRIGVKARIAELEREYHLAPEKSREIIKKKILDLSLEHQVKSAFSSFVGADIVTLQHAPQPRFDPKGLTLSCGSPLSASSTSFVSCSSPSSVRNGGFTLESLHHKMDDEDEDVPKCFDAKSKETKKKSCEKQSRWSDITNEEDEEKKCFNAKRKETKKKGCDKDRSCDTQSKQKSDMVNQQEVTLNLKGQEIHLLVTCDDCHTTPLVGKRYKCQTCANFDFCEHCYNRSLKTGKHFDGKHAFAEESQWQLKRDDLYEVHQNVHCDLCEADPIRGHRYQCDTCAHFNVCGNCYSMSLQVFALHPPNHKWRLVTLQPPSVKVHRNGSPPQNPERKFTSDKIIQSQKIEGYWEHSPYHLQRCARLLNLDRSVVDGLCTLIKKHYQWFQNNRAAWATMITLLTLHHAFSDKKTEWDLVAGKAHRWLQKQTPAPPDLLAEFKQYELIAEGTI